MIQFPPRRHSSDAATTRFSVVEANSSQGSVGAAATKNEAAIRIAAPHALCGERN
jgi:hypothetical protein